MVDGATQSNNAIFIIRPGNKRDFERLSAIKVSATKMFGPDYQTEPLSEKNFTRFLESDKLRVVVRGKEVCGYSGAFQMDHDLFLLHLFVATDYQGQGLGKMLLHETIAQAKAANLKAITLVTSGSAPWNGPFYTKQGFKTLDGEMPSYLRVLYNEDVAYFHPERPFVKESPLILPRIAMQMDLT